MRDFVQDWIKTDRDMRLQGRQGSFAGRDGNLEFLFYLYRMVRLPVDAEGRPRAVL